MAGAASSQAEELQRLQNVIQFVKIQVMAFSEIAGGNQNLQTFLKTLRDVLSMENDPNSGSDQSSSGASALSKGKAKGGKVDLIQPPELNLMFEPLKCLLCAKEFNSGTHAKQHYDGKRHRNRTILWLQQKGKANKTKNKRAAGADSSIGEDGATDELMDEDHNFAEDGPPSTKKLKEAVPVDQDDPNRYCKICSVTLVTENDIKGHYAGKRHQGKLIKIQKAASGDSGNLGIVKSETPTQSSGNLGHSFVEDPIIA